MQSTDITVTNIIKGIENVKGENICVLDFTELENVVCKYFVICDCQSNTQVNAISNSVKRTLSKNIKEKPYQIDVNGIHDGHSNWGHKKPKRKWSRKMRYFDRSEAKNDTKSTEIKKTKK